MCFSNLPVEFDADGNPRLADEAEDVTRPEPEFRGDGEDLASDPQAAYDAIVESLPNDARERLRGQHPDGDAAPPEPNAAGSD